MESTISNWSVVTFSAGLKTIPLLKGFSDITLHFGTLNWQSNSRKPLESTKYFLTLTKVRVYVMLFNVGRIFASELVISHAGLNSRVVISNNYELGTPLFKLALTAVKPKLKKKKRKKLIWFIATRIYCSLWLLSEMCEIQRKLIRCEFL